MGVENVISNSEKRGCEVRETSSQSFQQSTVEYVNQVTSDLKNRLIDLKRRSAAWSAVPFHRFFGRIESAGVAVITYHRVMPELNGKRVAPLSVTPKRFASHIASLLSTGCEPISIGELVRRQQSGVTSSAPTFAVVFDDGFESVHRFALPILQDLSVPATVFLPTAFLDTSSPMPFDAWHHAGEENVPVWTWRALSSKQADQMLNTGLIELGSHTHTHAHVGDDVDAFKEDLETSVAVLRSKFGVESPHFSFPFGEYCIQMQQVVREAGLSCAFTSECGNVHRCDNSYRWKRLGAEEWDSQATLAAKVDGWFEHLRTRWQSTQRHFRGPAKVPSPTRS
ncbi:MAG TPA: polysaccharide deacetylase family protein [Planctomycetaceae bacterium]|nr:polysaccharide deacetylase family protein [Planctomycetaceae bacterium]